MPRRLREMLDGLTGLSPLGSRILPTVLGVLALLIFVWVLTGAFSGSGGEQAASRSQLAQAPNGSQNGTSLNGSQEAPVPQSENKNVDSYAAYTNKDPFRQLVKPAGGSTKSGSSGPGNTSGSGSGGGSTSSASGGGTGSGANTPSNGGNANGGSSSNSSPGDSTTNNASSGGAGAGKGTVAERKRAVRMRAARMRRAAIIQARRQARAQATGNNARNGLPNSGGRLPDTGGILSGGYK
ncbi:MAG: hypothetical protein ACR2GU_06760 [Rubrobacteraceae bacterium]